MCVSLPVRGARYVHFVIIFPDALTVASGVRALRWLAHYTVNAYRMGVRSPSDA